MENSKNFKVKFDDKYHIKVTENGPYAVSGGVPLDKNYIGADKKGNSTHWENGKEFPQKESYNLCRCGHSGNKPYCDGTHGQIKFNGIETASRDKYLDQAEIIPGQEIDLSDAVAFCASGRFCDPKPGVWNLTQMSDDPKSKEKAIEMACNCPSGRLVAWDKKSGKPLEPLLKKSISLIEDPPGRSSGPIWVKGGIVIESADGEKYEVRNRVTLCRCGQSQNKPFCDSSHISVRFDDGDQRIKPRQ